MRSRFEYGWVRGLGVARIHFGLSDDRADHPGIWNRLHCHWASDLAPDRGRRGILGTRDFFSPQRRTALRSNSIRQRIGLTPITQFQVVDRGGIADFGQPRDARFFCDDCPERCGDQPRRWERSLVRIRRCRGDCFCCCRPFLLHRLKPEIAMAVSATACLVRWALLAESTSIVAIAAAEPLHGFTFALLHLSCMRVLATIVPRELAGLAQAIYGTVGVGLTSAVLTFFSGSLYTEFGAQGFWAMFLIALSALPAIWRLYRVRT